MSMNWKSRLILLVTAICICSCNSGLRGNTGAILVSDLRPIPPIFHTVPMTIDRKVLRDMIEQGTEGTEIRLVPIYSSNSGLGINEYRLFDIHQGSVYTLLGLENSDILVSAHGYVVKDRSVFPAYIAMLLTLNSSEIEVRRDGRPTVFKYTIVPELK